MNVKCYECGEILGIVQTIYDECMFVLPHDCSKEVKA